MTSPDGQDPAASASGAAAKSAGQRRAMSASLTIAAEARPGIAALIGRRKGIMLARIVMLFVVTFFLWANFAELNEVATAPGEVVPQGNVKVIQHLEGGIVRGIHVQEGATVKVGTPLVSLDLGAGGLNPAELQAQLDAMLLKRARLSAESEGTKLKLDPVIAKRRADVAFSERRAYRARERELSSGLGALREQVIQAERSVRELTAKRSATANDLSLARRAFAMSQSLVSQGLTSKLEHLERLRLVRRLEGELSVLDESVPKAEAALKEARGRLVEINLRFQRDASEQLAQLEGEIARIQTLYTRATDQARRTEIKSPIDGVVKNMRYHTIGGVVRPGEPIMEIVPTDDSLVIEARLSPTDRGYVRVGQPAIVKISTYEYIRYGGLEGTVSQIAADANDTRSGSPYFRVIIKTKHAYLSEGGVKLPISPGMQATVDIKTSERTVMHYLMKPVLKLQSEAFRER
jgi:membrane fusion protein, adhesin transport system